MDELANGHAPDTATTSHAVPPEPGATASARPTLAEADALACTCGHPHAQHDAIATRYCLATATGHLDRGCICADAAAPQA